MPNIEIAFQFICNNNVETLCLSCSLPDKFRGTVVKMVTQAKRGEVQKEPSYFQCDEQLGNYIKYLLQNHHLLTFKSPTSSQSVSSGASTSVGGGGVTSQKDYLHSFSPAQQLPAPIQVRMRRPVWHATFPCLVFRKKDLYLIITQKLIFLKSGGFHEIWWISWNPADFMKSTQNLIKSDVSTKTLQFWGCRGEAMTQDFMKSWFIAPLLHSSNWRFGWNICFYKVLADFMQVVFRFWHFLNLNSLISKIDTPHHY